MKMLDNDIAFSLWPSAPADPDAAYPDPQFTEIEQMVHTSQHDFYDKNFDVATAFGHLFIARRVKL